jgi:Domain of unknown function (DUF4391)
VDVAFYKSLIWRDMPKDDLHVVHEAWHVRVDALKASRLTGTFALCSTAAQSISRRRMLTEYVGHFQDRRWLKNQLATAVSPVRRAELDAEIQRLNAAIESIRVSLRLMTPDPGGRSGRATRPGPRDSTPSPRAADLAALAKDPRIPPANVAKLAAPAAKSPCAITQLIVWRGCGRLGVHGDCVFGDSCELPP